MRLTTQAQGRQLHYIVKPMQLENFVALGSSQGGQRLQETRLENCDTYGSNYIVSIWLASVQSIAASELEPV